MATDDLDSLSDLRRALFLHTKTLPEDAPLRSLIASRSIEDKIAEFDAADARALKQQRAYRFYGRLALWCTLAGTFVGAVVLLPIDELIAGWPRRTIESVQAAALTLAVVLVAWVAMRQPVGRWMGARAAAERIRGEVFDAIVQAGARERLLVPALACFKAAHLDWQLDFFRRRGAQHRRAAGLANWYRVPAYLLMFFPVALATAGFVTFLSDLGLTLPRLAEWAAWLTPPNRGRWQLGLGTMASSVLAFAGARSFMDQDDRNAACYAIAEQRLEALKQTRLTGAQQAAAAGDADVVREFCHDVQAVLDAEHLSWGFTFARPARTMVIAPNPRI